MVETVSDQLDYRTQLLAYIIGPCDVKIRLDVFLEGKRAVGLCRCDPGRFRRGDLWTGVCRRDTGGANQIDGIDGVRFARLHSSPSIIDEHIDHRESVLFMFIIPEVSERWRTR